ncbi:MAG TPA: helicase [Brevundimonas sp.]|uniref:helicase n=1 Tax=uncultured Brevundimonas sp. TaxID=213418 RepID=UPI000C988829|nr:helicase [Brevundimonas sp.]HAF80019.1 helicase [Brevundimonas sp.]
MGSRRKTGVEDARLPEISRRGLIAGTSVVAFGLGSPAAGTAAASANLAPAALVSSTEAARQCKNWLAIDAQIERLQNRWAKLEGWLIREHSWCNLSHTEQQALPWSKELRDIDGILDTLIERRERLLEAIPHSASVSFEAIIARLAVLERLIWPEDHPEAHAMIARSRQDLIALSADIQPGTFGA